MKMRDVKPRRAPLHALPLLLAGAIALALALAACGSDDALITLPGGEPEYEPRYVYVTNEDFDQIHGFEIDTDSGELTEMGGSPFATGSEPREPVSNPGEPWLWVAHVIDDEIATYAIDPDTGELTDTGNAVFVGSVTGPYDLALHPDGEWLYSANVDDYSVGAFAADPDTGNLTSAGALMGTGDEPFGVAVHPSGGYVYSIDFSGQTVTGFEINSGTGALQATVPGTPILAGGGGDPSDLIVHPDGGFIYTAERAANTSYRLTVDETDGTLSGGTELTQGDSTAAVAVHPSGDYLYLTTDVGTVLAYSIGGNGALSPLTPASYAAHGGSYAYDMTIDSSGSMLVTANAVNDTFTVNLIDESDGSLSEVPGSPYVLSGTVSSVWVHLVEVTDQ